MCGSLTLLAEALEPIEVKLSLKACKLEAAKVLCQDVFAELVLVMNQQAFAVGLPGNDAREGITLNKPLGSS